MLFGIHHYMAAMSTSAKLHTQNNAILSMTYLLKNLTLSHKLLLLHFHIPNTSSSFSFLYLTHASVWNLCSVPHDVFFLFYTNSLQAAKYLTQCELDKQENVFNTNW